jgi:hypothetical protein
MLTQSVEAADRLKRLTGLEGVHDLHVSIFGYFE